MSLRELLSDAAAGLPDVEAGTRPGGEVTWSHAGRPFAVLSGDGKAAEFELDAAVAAAAARTPDVVPSGRGPGWVLFRPAALDDHAADRVAAWLASAHLRLSRG
ncbi:MAG: hypothetical protein Q7S35_09025 [Candidatus Limnocylindrales bacterium]|nr:hypothetical protein [Candidatus Limnocylindrales bacterium]